MEMVDNQFCYLLREALIKSKISCGAECMVSWEKRTGGVRKWDR